MLLYRAEQHRLLELLRNLALEKVIALQILNFLCVCKNKTKFDFVSVALIMKVVPTCQRCIRGTLARIYARKVRRVQTQLTRLTGNMSKIIVSCGVY